MHKILFKNIFLILFFQTITTFAVNTKQSDNVLSYAITAFIVLVLMAIFLVFLFCLPLFGYCYSVFWSVRNPPPIHEMKPYKEVNEEDYERLEQMTQHFIATKE